MQVLLTYIVILIVSLIILSASILISQKNHPITDFSSIIATSPLTWRIVYTIIAWLIILSPLVIGGCLILAVWGW